MRNFLELKGPNYTLRCPHDRHLEGLVSMLQDHETVKNSTHRVYNDIEQIRKDYLSESYYNFKNKISICFVVEDNNTGKAVGFREVFIDSNKENVTIQGFTHPNYRRKGVSKESYIILIRYLKIFGVSGITANADFQNFASIALLYSVGFKQVFLSDTSQGMRGIYQLDLNAESDETNVVGGKDLLYKRLLIFCKMYLGAASTNIQPYSFNQINYNNMNYQEYEVSLSAINWACAIYPIGVTKKMLFRSNGIVIESVNSTFMALIDGCSPYIDPWGFCWELCAY